MANQTDASHEYLINADLAPTEPAHRTWNQWHFAALWVGMAVCIPTYTIASNMIGAGMAWWQAVLTVCLGNLIVLVPLLLNAHAGAQYGIPFPVLARASFGVLGSNIPALMRGLVACGWFGIQTWIGGWALFQLLATVWPSIPGGDPTALWPGAVPFICFIAFWLVNVFFIWKGTESIRWMETLAAPFLLLMGLVLLGWAVLRVGGLGPILDQNSEYSGQKPFWSTFLPNLTAMVGFWATLSLNIPDFTRYARNQRAQVVGQALGLPTTMTLFAFIGAAVTSATVLIFGEAIWDPVALLGRIGGVGVVGLSMIALSIATLSTNIAANVVSPANDLSNLAPRLINFRLGGLITAFLGIVIMPWRLYSDPSGYIFTWLIGYSALLGPIGGILIADYYVIRRKLLDVPELYKRHGKFSYGGSGFNLRAIVVLFLSILPNVPGFLVNAGLLDSSSVHSLLLVIYGQAWFVGFVVAFALYTVLMWKERHSVLT